MALVTSLLDLRLPLKIHPLARSHAQILQWYFTVCRASVQHTVAVHLEGTRFTVCDHEASAAGVCALCRAVWLLSRQPATSVPPFLQDYLVRLTNNLPSSLVSLCLCIRARKRKRCHWGIPNTKHQLEANCCCFLSFLRIMCPRCDNCCRLFGMPCADVGDRLVQQIQAFSPAKACEKCHYVVSVVAFFIAFLVDDM